MNKLVVICCFLLSIKIANAQNEANDTGEGVFYSIEDAKKKPSEVKVLILEHQSYNQVPDQIAQFNNIEVLSLKGNSIAALPAFFTQLAHLHDLNLGENIFAAL